MAEGDEPDADVVIPDSGNREVEVLEGDSTGALTIRLHGVRFDGGRVPLSALDTLHHLDDVVKWVSRDIDLSLRPDAQRASKYANIELALVGEIEEGSSILKLLFVPLALATSGASLDKQQELLSVLPEAVPATVEAVFAGEDPPYPISQRTAEAVSKLGSRLGAEEELIIRPFDSGTLDEAVDDKAVTVTLERSNSTRQAQQVVETRPFFVTGTLRKLENHGDEPGSLSLATSVGIFNVPDVSTGILSRAGGIIKDAPKSIVAISGRGEFDGKGRLQRLTHLTDMEAIDRIFNPDRRFAELVELSESVARRIANSRPAIERAVLATGRAPGLFVDEDDDLEARWLIRINDEPRPRIVVSVTFGSQISVYVYDRSTREVTRDAVIDAEGITPGDQIARIIQLAERDANA